MRYKPPPQIEECKNKRRCKYKVTMMYQSCDPNYPEQLSAPPHVTTSIIPPRYDVNVIASMQATMAYLMERVSILETRLLQQQEMITCLKASSENTNAHTTPDVLIQQQTQTQTITRTNDVTNEDDEDVKTRRKLIF